MKGSLFALMAVAMVALQILASPSWADAAGADCNAGIMQQLSACAAYVAPSTSPAAQPSRQCCASLQGVDLSCMCQVINGPSIPNLDKTRALALPQACNLASTATCTSG